VGRDSRLPHQKPQQHSFTCTYLSQWVLKINKKRGKSLSLSSQMKSPVFTHISSHKSQSLTAFIDISETEFRIAIKLDDGRHEDEEDLEEERMYSHNTPYIYTQH
jgi:hypothetical protein